MHGIPQLRQNYPQGPRRSPSQCRSEGHCCECTAGVHRPLLLSCHFCSKCHRRRRLRTVREQRCFLARRAGGTVRSSPARIDRRANKHASRLPQCRHREVSHSQFACVSCVVCGCGHQCGDTTIHLAGVLFACSVARFLPMSTGTLALTVAPVRACSCAPRVLSAL